MPRLVCWVLVAILAGMAVTVTSHSQQGCVLTPNEPPTRTGQFLASQGQAVYVDGVNNSCGMDQERGTVIVPSLLGQGVLGDLRPRDCYSSMCRTRKQRELFHQKVTLIARFVGPTLGPSGADRAQVYPMWAP